MIAQNNLDRNYDHPKILPAEITTPQNLLNINYDHPKYSP